MDEKKTIGEISIDCNLDGLNQTKSLLICYDFCGGLKKRKDFT